MKRQELRIRDPFILTDKKNGCYYMYGTTALVDESHAARSCFHGYKSYDLEEFEGPFLLVDAKKESLWGDRDFWAAEVHYYKGKYYLFGSMKSETRARGTHIFVSDSPLGDFKKVSDDPATPGEWECLDGTFYVDKGIPYIIFCREWLEVENGGMYAAPLTDDLSKSAAEPILLFNAGDSPCVKAFASRGFENAMITDGPFIIKRKNKFFMIWSSNTKTGYAVLLAESENLLSGWTHHKKPLYSQNGGHGMIFTDLQDNTKLAIHSPNSIGKERAVFLDIDSSLFSQE